MRIPALDTGGASIKPGIWDGVKTTELKEHDTNAMLGGKKLMETVINIIKTYDNFEPIGISTAGQADTENGRRIFEAVDTSDIRMVVDGWINKIVYGLVTLIHIFNPTNIILSGGILAKSYVIGKIKELLFKYVSPKAREVRIRQAMLGNVAGITGAGALAEELIGK